MNKPAPEKPSPIDLSSAYSEEDMQPYPLARACLLWGIVALFGLALMIGFWEIFRNTLQLVRWVVQHD